MKPVMASLLAVLLLQTPSLDSPSPRERLEAVAQLAVLGNREGVAPIAAALKKEPREDVRLAMVRGLGTIHDPAVLPVLGEALKDDASSAVRLEIIGTLVRYYIPSEPPGRLRRLISRVRNVFVEPDRPSVDERSKADPAVGAALIAAIERDFVTDVRIEAARALGSLRAEDQVDALIAVLEDPRNREQNDVRREVVITLGQIRNGKAGPVLEKLLSDRHRPVRDAAIEAAGLVGHVPARPALERIFRAGGRLTPQRALDSIALLRDPGAKPFFESLIDSKNDLYREAAIEGLARLDYDASALGPKFAAEKKDNVRMAMAFALASSGKTERIADLVGALNSRQADQARVYLYELGRFRNQLPELHRYLQTPDPVMRARLVRIVGLIGDGSSRAYVEPLTSDSNLDVAREAVQAMRLLIRTP